MQVQTPRKLTAFTISKFSAGSSAASLGGTLDSGVVGGHVQPAEGSDGTVDHGCNVRFVRDVAAYADRLMPAELSPSVASCGPIPEPAPVTSAT
jgi:hypothetical protein